MSEPPTPHYQQAMLAAIAAQQQRAWMKQYGNWPTSPQIYGGALGAANQGDPRAQALAFLTTQQAAYFTPIEDAGIRAGEIIGWRVWRSSLRSVSHDYAWLPGISTASIPPEQNNFTGFWAYKTREALCAGNFSHVGFIIGTVQMWGQIIEHEHGYRSEFAKIHSLDDIIGRRGLLSSIRAKWHLRALRKIYGL